MLVHWGAIFFALSLLIAWQWRKKVPLLYLGTFVHLINLANTLFSFRQLGMWYATDVTSVFLLSTSCFSAFTILLFSMGAVYTSSLNCEKILKASLLTYGIAGALLDILFRIRIIPHASSNATMMALAIPYLIAEKLNPWKIIGLILILISIVDSNTSSPIGVASVVIGAYLLLTKRYKLIFISLVPLIAGICVYGAGRLFDDTLRFQAYRVFMGWWWKDTWIINLFGYGPGSFEILSQVIQEKERFLIGYNANGRIVGELWLHMHNDWLQFVFEYGIIGFVLIVLCAVRLFMSLDGYTKERAILVGVASSMIFCFPFRYPGVPLVLVLLFGLSQRNANEKN